MTKYFLVVLLSILISSCQQDKRAPSIDISEEKIIEILADMHYVNEASRINRKINTDSLLIVYKAEMFAIHGITEAKYKEIKTYLEADLDNYYKIEQKVHKYMKDVRDANTKSPKK